MRADCFGFETDLVHRDNDSKEKRHISQGMQTIALVAVAHLSFTIIGPIT
jgi:hypothetical protein